MKIINPYTEILTPLDGQATSTRTSSPLMWTGRP